MKLTIENFQSLKGVNELEFPTGVTMIIGDSNSGKTALQRALRGLITNYISTSKVKKYITHFEDHLKVDLQLGEDQPKFSWLKDEKNTNYSVIDGDEVQEFEKCGNDTLESICDKADVEFPFVLRDKRLLNLHTEKDSFPFPFDLNDVELFKMFEELYNVSSSGIIFKYMKSLETKTNSQIKTTTENIRQDKDKIEKIIDLEDKYSISELDALKIRAEKVQAGMLGIDEDIASAAKNNKIAKKIKEFLEHIEQFSIDEDTDKLVNKAITLLNDSKVLSKDIRQVIKNNEIEQINVYKKEFDTAQIDAYNALSSDYKEASKLINEIKSVNSEIEELEEEQKQIEAELAKIKICPLCKQPLKGKS